MRINKYVALATGLSRRKADAAISQGEVTVNDTIADIGVQVEKGDVVALRGKHIVVPHTFTTIMLHKPIGYVCSRDGQGCKTIYDVLPTTYQNLNPIGRLDKDSTGLLLLTNNGTLSQSLMHPSSNKTKVYMVTLDKQLLQEHAQLISGEGVLLEDGMSRLELKQYTPRDATCWWVSMQEGRNRQIRRTFSALGYTVIRLHRTQFGEYQLKNLAIGKYKLVTI